MAGGKGIRYHGMRKAVVSDDIRRLISKSGKEGIGILKSHSSSGSLHRDASSMSEKIGRIVGIDVDVQIVFKEENISLLLPHFATVGLEASVLDDLINAYIASGEKVPYAWWFLDYGQRVINPMMNKKLRRDERHPTFNNLLRHALKEKLADDPTLKALGTFRR